MLDLRGETGRTRQIRSSCVADRWWGHCPGLRDARLWETRLDLARGRRGAGLWSPTANLSAEHDHDKSSRPV